MNRSCSGNPKWLIYLAVVAYTNIYLVDEYYQDLLDEQQLYFYLFFKTGKSDTEAAFPKTRVPTKI